MAQGVYTPVVPVNIGSVTHAERAVAFNIAPNATVYGDFVGGETLLFARNPATHVTILSGDLDNNAVSFVFWGIVSGGCSNSCANLVEGDPMLGPQADNGGFTPTVLPGAGGSAINTVPCYVALATDRRDYALPDPPSAALRNPCDIGAVDVGSIDSVFPSGFEAAP